ncbi:MAG: MBL fold metallo-hydrolase [Betaproteobacteria bacterium]|nr:MBL fold metallo-hydrolase [Betaproteobacteria bacterium]
MQIHATAAASALVYPISQPPSADRIVSVAPGVYWLRLPLPFALDHINIWLLRDGAAWTLVDCGYGDAATTTLWQEHAAGWLRGLPLRRIVVTHCHPDHVGQASGLSANSDAAIWMSQGEYLSAHAMHDQTAGFGVAPLLDLFAAHGMAEEELDGLRARGNRYRHGVPELPRAYHRLAEGDRVAIDGHSWRVIVGLGHSPEHVALHSEELGILISGDMLLPKITTNVSVWPTEPEADPLGRFLHSIQRFADLPANTLVLPSHGLPFRGIHSRLQQLEAHHEARLAELLGAIRQTPQDAASLRRTLFPRELDLQQLFFAMGETIAHLNHLVALQRIQRHDRGDRVRFTRV